GPDHPHVRRIQHGRQHDGAAVVDGGWHPPVVRRLAAGTRARRQPAPRGRQGLGREAVHRRRPMSYRDYVIAAYAVFAVVLLWDYLAPRLQVRAALRAARLRATRAAAARAEPTELQR